MGNKVNWNRVLANWRKGSKKKGKIIKFELAMDMRAHQERANRLYSERLRCLNECAIRKAVEDYCLQCQRAKIKVITDKEGNKTYKPLFKCSGRTGYQDMVKCLLYPVRFGGRRK